MNTIKSERKRVRNRKKRDYCGNNNDDKPELKYMKSVKVKSALHDNTSENMEPQKECVIAAENILSIDSQHITPHSAVEQFQCLLPTDIQELEQAKLIADGSNEVGHSCSRTLG